MQRKFTQRRLTHINPLHATRPYLLYNDQSTNQERKVLLIMLMLLLLVGFFGLFAGLVFFSEGVIAPEQIS